MWEVLVRAPRGSTNPRKFSMLLATFLVATFGYIFATAPSVSAADATWSDGNVVYEDKTYVKVDASDAFPQEVRSSSAIYQYVDSTPDPDLIYVIYFAEGAAQPMSEEEATYVRFTLNPPNRYINGTDPQTIRVVPVPEGEIPHADDTITNNCTIEGVGWFVCPLMNAISGGMDWVYGKIQGFLVVQPISTSVDNPIYRIWTYSRDLANILFVIGFLVIIYSYLVGGGFDGYSIRKILPRLVIAAVLINLSYILCAVAVDISNISGYGVNQLFESVQEELPGSDTAASVNWTSVTAWVLAGGVGAGVGFTALSGATAGALATGLWYMLLPLLFGGALLIFVTFIILSARQAIIIILIAVAPLAFAAFILPNTEKYFEKWRSLFFTMLIMFPAFGAVFGGAQLAGEVIIRTAVTMEQIILGLAVMAAPLAITPLLLKLGGGVLNRFGGIVNNPQKGLYDRYKNYNKDRLSEHVARNNAKNAELQRTNGFRGGVFGQHMRRSAARSYAKNNFREGMKKRDEEKAQNEWGAQTGRWGGDNHEQRDGVKSRLTRRPVQGYGNLDEYSRRNSAFHDNHESHHDEHWQQVLRSDVPLRDMVRDTAMTKGRAGVMSGAIEAQDERSFQAALDTNAGYTNLRNMKVNTTVDSGVAEIHKAAIDSAGKIALSTTVDDNRELRKTKVQTFENEKRAETIDNTHKKNAEANWNNLSKNDAAVQQLRLREVQATDQANITEQRYNTMVENIVASGSAAPGVVSGAVRLADSIKDIRQDIQIETRAQESAKVQQNVNLMSALKASQETIIDPTKGGDPTLLVRAAGIGGKQAEARIFAQATKSVVNAAVEEVKDDRYLLSQHTRSQLHKVLFEGRGLQGEKVTTEMQQAAMYELLEKKGNNDDAQIIRNAVRGMGMVVDDTTGEFYEPELDSDGRVVIENGRPKADRARKITDNDEIGRRRDWQQFFVDAAKSSPHSQTTLSGTDKSDAEAGTMLSGVRDGFMRDAKGGKFGPEKMLKADIDELKFLYTDMKDPKGEYQHLTASDKARVDKTITESIVALQRHPTYKGQIDERNRGVMNQIIALTDSSYVAGRDADGKPMFYVDEDKAIMPPPAVITGNERTFTAPVMGDMAFRSGPDWDISRNW